MKLAKYTFRTPLFGSIHCEDVLPDRDGYIELSPEQMCRMYDTDPKLMLFLSENTADLASCVPQEMADIVFRAEFGDFAILSGKMWLVTNIWVTGGFTESGIAKIQEWITGQLSDGWGESIEQKTWKKESVKKPTLHFDEYSCEFEEDYDYGSVSYYVCPWNSEDFEIYLEGWEEVEEEVEPGVVATMNLPHHNRQVVKLPSLFTLRMFLKDFGRPDIAALISDACPLPECSFYLVRAFEGESGPEILTRWVCEHGKFCSVYNQAYEVEVIGTQMPLKQAILELLK